MSVDFAGGGRATLRWS